MWINVCRLHVHMPLTHIYTLGGSFVYTCDDKYNLCIFYFLGV